MVIRIDIQQLPHQSILHCPYVHSTFVHTVHIQIHSVHMYVRSPHKHTEGPCVIMYCMYVFVHPSLQLLDYPNTVTLPSVQEIIAHSAPVGDHTHCISTHSATAYHSIQCIHTNRTHCRTTHTVYILLLLLLHQTIAV